MFTTIDFEITSGNIRWRVEGNTWCNPLGHIIDQVIY